MSTPERDIPLDEEGVKLPRAFGDYLLLHQLGRGGMGEVYLAKTGGIAGIEKLCVVKTLRGDLTSDDEYKQRFIDEARVVVQLGHRNICHVFDVGRVSRSYYLAMEHVAGRDLRTILRKVWDAQLQVPRDVMIYLICEVLEALDYAHRLKDPLTGAPLHVVHRDVSPQNVMVNFEGEVKLIDFGLAQSTMKIERTAPRIVMGKLAYMPPEQARGHDVDGRVDQFAVGVMCYEAVTGRSFYEGKTADQVWMLSGRGGHRPDAYAELDEELRRILDRALHVEAGQRYETCQDFRQDLMRYNLSHGSLAGARELRELMDGLFYDDVSTDRSLLQKFANVKPLDPRPRERSKKEKTVRIATAVVRREDVGLGPAEQDAPTGSGPSLPDDAATMEGTAPGVEPPAPRAEATQIMPPGQTATQADPPTATAPPKDLATEPTVIKPKPQVLAPPTESDDDPTEQVGAEEQARHLGAVAPAPRAEATQLVRTRSKPDVDVFDPGMGAAQPQRRSLLSIGVAAAAFLAVLSVGLVVALGSDDDEQAAVEPAALAVQPKPIPDEPPTDDAPAVPPTPAQAVAESAPQPEPPAPAEPAPVAEPTPNKVTKKPSKQPRRARRRSATSKPPPKERPVTATQKVAYLKKYCTERVSCAKGVVAGQKAAILSDDPGALQRWQKRLNRCVASCQR
jgi:serine/threonine-protein kinase